MKELQPNILDDYEHRITLAVERHGDEPDFPQLGQYGIDRERLSSYLFDYQAILDGEGSQRAQLTLYGIIAIVPVLVLSAFPEAQLPWGRWSLLVGIGMGVLLSVAVKAVRLSLKNARLRKLRGGNSDLAAYCDAVSNYVNLYKRNIYE